MKTKKNGAKPGRKKAKAAPAESSAAAEPPAADEVPAEEEAPPAVQK